MGSAWCTCIFDAAALSCPHTAREGISGALGRLIRATLMSSLVTKLLFKREGRGEYGKGDKDRARRRNWTTNRRIKLISEWIISCLRAGHSGARWTTGYVDKEIKSRN